MDDCKDDRWYTPRQSARTAGSSSSDGEAKCSPRTHGVGDTIWESDSEFFGTPRDLQSPLDESKVHAWDSFRAAARDASASFGDYRQHATDYKRHHNKLHVCAEDGLVRPMSPYSPPVRAESRFDSDCTDRDTVHKDTVENIFSLARHNRVDEIERVLKRGIPPDVRDEYGNTILIIACQNGHKRVAKAALRRGCDINAINARGNTGLHFCFAYGYGDTLGAYLISKGADPGIVNTFGLTCYQGLSR